MHRRTFTKTLGAGAIALASSAGAAAPAPAKVKVGLITHAEGAHLSAYFPALAEAEEVESVALSDPSGDTVEAARKALGSKLASTYTDPSAMLAAEKPAMALVSMEAKLAPPAIDAALDAGCHVMAEKPSCVRAEDFEPLARKANQKNLHLMLASCKPAQSRSPRGAATDSGRENRKDLRNRNPSHRRPDAPHAAELPRHLARQESSRRRRPSHLARHPLARPGHVHDWIAHQRGGGLHGASSADSPSTPKIPLPWPSSSTTAPSAPSPPATTSTRATTRTSRSGAPTAGCKSTSTAACRCSGTAARTPNPPSTASSRPTSPRVTRPSYEPASAPQPGSPRRR